MLHKKIFFGTLLTALVMVFAGTTNAQKMYASDKVEYQFELPSPMWKIVQEPDGLQQQAEFIYGDRLDGYLRIRKDTVTADETPETLLRREQEQKLSFLKGYIAGKQENFAGKFSGLTFAYEYVNAGKKMAGRIYILRADNLTTYTLRFTGLQDRLNLIRNQTDSIARTFAVK